MPLVFLDVADGSYWKTWERYVVEHLLGGGMISEQDLQLFLVTHDVEQAVEEIRRFYRVYHSSRYVGDRFVMRLNRALAPGAVADLGTAFRDIIAGGDLVQCGALREERDEPELANLPRLVFRFDRTHFARLRMMINRLNEE